MDSNKNSKPDPPTSPAVVILDDDSEDVGSHSSNTSTLAPAVSSYGSDYNGNCTDPPGIVSDSDGSIAEEEIFHPVQQGTFFNTNYPRNINFGINWEYCAEDTNRSTPTGFFPALPSRDEEEEEDDDDDKASNSLLVGDDNERGTKRFSPSLSPNNRVINDSRTNKQSQNVGHEEEGTKHASVLQQQEEIIEVYSNKVDASLVPPDIKRTSFTQFTGELKVCTFLNQHFLDFHFCCFSNTCVSS